MLGINYPLKAYGRSNDDVIDDVTSP